MIKAIDSNYCIGDFVQLMPYTDACQLIMSTDEILLLKVGNKVLVNKYTNHPNRYLFPYSDKEKNSINSYSNNYNQLFEYNKLYLNFRGSVSGYGFHKNYFFKGTNRALYFNESLCIDQRNAIEDETYFTREEVEKIFDSTQYDSMYIIDVNGFILYANSKKDGCIINRKIIPTDNEIIDLEAEERISNLKNALMSVGNCDDILNIDRKNKKLDEIRNLKLYGPILSRTYSHFFITSKDGDFNVQWFRLDFVEEDKFKLTTSPIRVIEPTVDDVIDYSNKHNIENTPEPYISESDETIKKAIKNIPEDLPNKITLEEKDFYGDGPRNAEGSFSKTLKKIFRNNQKKIKNFFLYL